MAKKKHIVAIFDFTTGVPDFLNDVNSFKIALTTAPGNTRVTIDPLIITDLETDVAALVLAQGNVENNLGTAADRDIAWDVVKIDVRGLVSTVQSAADTAVDEQTSVAIVEDCGLRVRKDRVFTKPEVAVTHDENITGLLHLVSIAAETGLRACYEWQMGTTTGSFTYAKTTPDSRTTFMTNAVQGSKLYFRRRIILSDKKGGAQAWSQVVSVIVM